MAKPLILISNDDGITANGISKLAKIAEKIGKVVVVAPDSAQSGKAHSISLITPIRCEKISSEKDIEKYVVYGTPVDCVKMALNKILDRKPDIMLSGINHGSNSAISLIYSGTMGAAIEACLYDIPTIGFSITSHDTEQDLTVIERTAGNLINAVLKNGLPKQTSLNVNYPTISENEFKGFKICKQTVGVWREDFEEVLDADGNKAFMQYGHFESFEPENQNSDEWALANGYASIVPVNVDFTDYKLLETLKNWNL